MSASLRLRSPAKSCRMQSNNQPWLSPLAGFCLLIGSGMLASAAAIPPDTGPQAWQIEGKTSQPSTQPVIPAIVPTRMPSPMPEQELYDVEHYEVELYVDLGTPYLSGSVTLAFAAVSEPLGEIVLDFAESMTVTTAQWGGGSLILSLGIQRSGNHLTVDLPGSNPNWDSGTITVDFEGTPHFDGFYGFQFTQTPAGAPIAASLSQPWSARSWWPCKDDPRDKATYRTILHVPAGMTGVSNGRLAALQDGGQTFVWEEDHPISTYHFSVAVTQYELLADVFVSGEDSLAIQHYVYPDFVEAASVDFASLPDMLEFCFANFGPYPFAGEKYGMALFEWEGAMEHPTCTSYGSHLVTGDGFYETIVLHELAHQWFGNLITCSDWTHTWLNEGFSTYAEALWAEQRYGFEDLQNFMAQRSNFTWWDEPLVRQPDDPDPWYYFHNMVYNKGAWVLHMLRHVIGDTQFQVCLQNYLNDPSLRYGVATTQDFVDICAAAVGQDLDWFFDQWLYWTVHPVYDISWSHAVPFDHRVQVTVSQVQPPDPVYGDLPFQMPLDLRLVSASLDTVVTVFNDQRVQTFEIEVPVHVVVVELDPGGWLLHEYSVITAALDRPAPAELPVQLLPPRPNPFNPLCLIRWESAVPSHDSIQIYDLQGHRLVARTLSQEPAGIREFLWDGRDGQGRACATGVYVYDITCQGGAAGGRGEQPDNQGGKSGLAPNVWRLKGKVTLAR